MKIKVLKKKINCFEMKNHVKILKNTKHAMALLGHHRFDKICQHGKLLNILQ